MQLSLRHSCVIITGMAYVLLATSVAYAAAWTQEAGQGQFITTTRYYQTERYFDRKGNGRGQLAFRKAEYGFYSEYGIADGLTLGGAFGLESFGQDTNSGTYGATGLSDPEMFLRQRVYNGDWGVVSVQPLLKLPAGAMGGTGQHTGTEYLDGELRTLYGYGFSGFGQQHFVNMEAAYRHRLGLPSDEMRVDTTLGLRSHENWLWLTQLFSTVSVEAEGNAALNIANSQDYDLHKLQLSAVKSFENGAALQFGVFQHIAGKNTGAGGGILVSFWFNF